MARRPHLVHWPLAGPVLVLAVGAQLEVFSRPLEGPRPLLVLTALASSLPLLAARRAPLASVSVAFAALATLALTARAATNEAAAPLFAGLAAAFLVARHAPPRQALWALVAALATVVLVARDQPGLATAVVTFAITAVMIGVTWGTGFALHERERRADAAERRAEDAEAGADAAARLAVAQERARISRELHDVVAHAVSVMVLQSGAVRHHLPAERTEDREALLGVERAGREALAELRRLLDAMRDGDGDDAQAHAPQPTLDGLGPLLADVTRAGLPARLHVEGERRRLPRGVELSAYRIVQEGLTNALKHARAQRVDVTLHFAEDGLEIEVRDDGRAPAPGAGGGHGLLGIQERVKVFGGAMSAGRDDGGDYVLRSRLPTGAGGP